MDGFFSEKIQRSLFPKINSSTISFATLSGYCIGGCFIMNADMLINLPPIPLSNANFVHLIVSIAHPALFGESSTLNFKSILTGVPPNFFLPF